MNKYQVLLEGGGLVNINQLELREIFLAQKENTIFVKLGKNIVNINYIIKITKQHE